MEGIIDPCKGISKEEVQEMIDDAVIEAGSITPQIVEQMIDERKFKTIDLSTASSSEVADMCSNRDKYSVVYTFNNVKYLPIKEDQSSSLYRFEFRVTDDNYGLYQDVAGAKETNIYDKIIVVRVRKTDGYVYGPVSGWTEGNVYVWADIDDNQKSRVLSRIYEVCKNLNLENAIHFSVLWREGEFSHQSGDLVYFRYWGHVNTDANFNPYLYGEFFQEGKFRSSSVYFTVDEANKTVVFDREVISEAVIGNIQS